MPGRGEPVEAFAVWVGDEPVAEGQLGVGTLDRHLVPVRHEGPIRLELRFADGREPDTRSLLLFVDALPPAIVNVASTLAQDPTIQIADESGTTRTASAFPLSVDDRVLYRLIDTPGFQRPRAVLDWLEALRPRDDE